jgi:hypothetical protein
VPERSNGLDARVTSLEQQMTAVSAEAKAAFVLAREADRDVFVTRDKLNAHTKVLNALRQTQLEHGEKLREHDARFDGLEREMRNGFSTLNVGIAQIIALLTGSAGSGRD